jgi:hypothetical protein
MERLRAALEDTTTRASRTSLDPRLFERMAPDGRAKAIELLSGRIAEGFDDPRVPIALWALGAHDHVREAASAGTWTRTRAAAAVCWWEREQDPRALDLLVDAVREATDPWARLSAFHYVRSLPGDEATWALVEAAAEGGPYVGGLVVRELIVRLVLVAHQAPPSLLATLPMRAASPLPSVRIGAATQLRELANGHVEGRTPEQLGLTVPPADPRAVERVRVSVLATDPGRPEIDVDSLIGLRNADRRWASELLLGRLATADPRVPSALAWFGGGAAQRALAEVDFGPPPFRDAVAAALESLKRSE